jgi:hypothetical protein
MRRGSIAASSTNLPHLGSESSHTQIARRPIDFIIGRTAAIVVEKAEAPDRDREGRRDDELSI